MNVTQAPFAQAEWVQRGLLTANEMQEAIQHHVHIGSSQCQVDAAFGSVTGSWTIGIDSKKRVIGKNFVFDCKKYPVKYCPYTYI